jgi:hypothetical protein
MQMEFYDVKNRQKVMSEVVDKQEIQVRGGTRYMVIGRTADGRKVTKFVSKADYDSISV